MKQFIVLIFIGLQYFSAQNLVGTWVNVFERPPAYDDIVLKEYKDGFYYGESFDTARGSDSCLYYYEAKYDPVENVFLGRDTKLIGKTNDHNPTVARLEYKKDGEDEYLDGYIRIVYNNGSLGSLIRARYKRKVEEKPKKEEKVVSPEEIAVVKKYKEERKNKRVSQLRLNTDNITIKVHDYGMQDKDSISIIYNDELVAYKIPINNEVKEYKLKLDPEKTSKLTFIAHNLGEVAPNTTYVEIVADDKVFKYTLFTNLEENATIELKRNKAKK